MELHCVLSVAAVFNKLLCCYLQYICMLFTSDCYIYLLFTNDNLLVKKELGKLKI